LGFSKKTKKNVFSNYAADRTKTSSATVENGNLTSPAVWCPTADSSRRTSGCIVIGNLKKRK